MRKRASDRHLYACFSHAMFMAVWVLVLFALNAGAQEKNAAESEASAQIFVWPKLAPGEDSLETGTALPTPDGESPPITRLVNIRRPSIAVYPAKSPNGTAVLVLPGGGFGRVVPDLEGSEAAPWLNPLGITVFVLHYRTNESIAEGEPLWKRPLQDAQRAMRLIRSQSEQYQIDPDRLGLLAFSAGGQVGAVLHTATEAAYEAMDDIDGQSFRPAFSMLIYPWRVLDESGERLLAEIRFSEKSPPAFLIHTHDDASSSLGSLLIYAGLKRHNVPAEIHVYENGGHGYGLRARKDSFIGTWPDRGTDWLVRRGLAKLDAKDLDAKN